MADTFEFELTSPQKRHMHEQVDMATIPGTDGYFGVLPHHGPFLSTLRPGIVDIHKNGQIVRRVFITGGFAEVCDNRCTVLAEEACDLSELSREVSEARLRTARQALADAVDVAAKVAAQREMEIAEAMMALVASAH